MAGKKKGFVQVLAALSVLLVFFVWATDTTLITRNYTIDSDKVSQPVTVAVVADLHSCDYGNHQSELMNAIKEAGPDIVVMPGDIVDDRMAMEKALEFFEKVSADYPCYYVSGNHEYWSGHADSIKTIIESYGIEVLEGENLLVDIDGQTIEICGVDDPDAGVEIWTDQIEQTMGDAHQEFYTILLSHRPELVDIYRECPVDLVLAGHAHGGQWRIPGVLNGLLAPNQGLFPDYAGGRYDLGNNTMIVSRGLAKESTRVPRFFNPPELVVVTIEQR